MNTQTIPQSVQEFMNQITEKCGKTHENWANTFNKTFANTLTTTVRQDEHGTFLLTGDIPAMWLRDSTAQVRPYLILAQTNDKMADLIEGVVKRQFMYINIDPYANAFNEGPDNAGHQTDKTEMNPWIWERKYEIDSLCYPVQLAYLLYKNTGRISQFTDVFTEGIKKILTVFRTEQHHETSPYTFEREHNRPEDTLPNNGRGTKVAYTGMTWSGFRPSDDGTTYGYLIPSNMFAVVILGYIQEIYTDLVPDEEIVAFARSLQREIRDGINYYGISKNINGEPIYAFEVDGLGNQLVMDDGNVPNLLSQPYLGFIKNDDPLYQATRETVLSKENPYYYAGKYGKGLGSPHTPKDYIWPISLAMEGLTTEDKAEKARKLDLLVATDANTMLMHEGFDVNNPDNFTREWFSWANMMFCELLLSYFDLEVRK